MLIMCQALNSKFHLNPPKDRNRYRSFLSPFNRWGNRGTEIDLLSVTYPDTHPGVFQPCCFLPGLRAQEGKREKALRLFSLSLELALWASATPPASSCFPPTPRGLLMPSFPGSTLARADQGERAPGAPPKRQGARRQRRGTGCRAVWGGRSAQVASTEQPQALWPGYCVVCERNSAAGLQVLPGEDSCPHLHLPTRPHQTQLCKSELQG